MSKSQRLIGTAYHEAGHALTMLTLNFTPTWTTIVPDGQGAAGMTLLDQANIIEYRHFDVSHEKRRYYERRTMVTLAGSAGHDLRFPRRRRDVGDQRDRALARELLDESGFSTSPAHMEAWLRALDIEVHDLLRNRANIVHAVADALLQRGTLLLVDIQRAASSAMARANPGDHGTRY